MCAKYINSFKVFEMIVYKKEWKEGTLISTEAEPVICNKKVGELLGIKEGTPIMHHVVEIQDIQGTPVVCEHLYSSGKQKKVFLEK